MLYIEWDVLLSDHKCCSVLYSLVFPSSKINSVHSCSVFLNDQSRSRGSRLNIIIVAEGAIDRQGKAITVDNVKDVST
jgi:hypothetical protein